MIRTIALIAIVSVGLMVVSRDAGAFRVFDGDKSGLAVDPGEVAVANACALLRPTAGSGQGAIKVQYWIDQASIPNYLTLDQARGAVRAAAGVWEAVSGLATPVSFVEVQTPPAPAAHGDFDAGDSVVVITWEKISKHVSLREYAITTNTCSTDGNAIWGPGADIYLNDFGWSTFQFPFVLLDEIVTLNWVTSRLELPDRRDTYLPSILAHEFGHVLGLAHSASQWARMYGQDSGLIWTVSLASDDVNGLRYLYGPNRFPVFAGLNVGNSALAPGQSTTLVVNATDAEDDALRYRWSKSGGNFVGCSTSNTCEWQAPSTPGKYFVTGGVRDVRHKFFVDRTVEITVGVPGETLSAELAAVQSSGAAPVNIHLTATASGTATGPISYTFYCDRGDVGTEVTPGWAAKFLGSTDNPKTVRNICAYWVAGTYKAKVVVQQGTAPSAEARVTVTVTGCGDSIVQTGEECDGSNLAGATCQTLGYNCGTLSCNPGSCTFNTSACASNQCSSSGATQCLDSNTQQRCADYGSGCLTWGAELPCAKGCAGGACATQLCGNSIQEGTEQCDGTDDATCPELCQADCTCARSPTPTDTPTTTPTLSATSTPTNTPTATVPPAWPMFGRNARHTGASDVVAAQTNGLRWAFATGGAVQQSPMIGENGRVFFGSNDGVFYAVNANGTEAWRGSFGAAAIGEDGTLYALASNSLVAMDENGQTRWTFTPNPAVGLPGLLLPSNGKVFLVGVSGCSICFQNGSVLAVEDDGSSARELWRTTGSYPAFYTVPALGMDGRIYEFDFGDIGFVAPRLFAFDATTGQATALGDYLSTKATAVIDSEGTLYFGDGGFSGIVFTGFFRALRPDGTVKWGGGGIVGGVAAVSNGVVYHGDYNSLVAQRTSDGGGVWGFTLNTDATNWYERNTQPAVDANGNVYVGSSSGIIYAINSNGTEKWRYQTGGAINTQPAIGSDGSVYVGSDDGKLYAFGPGPGWTPIPTATPTATIPAGVICGTANEGSTLTLTCPSGGFTTIYFASYGTPTGTCGAYMLGGCNATNSSSVVAAACLGRQTCSVAANNTTFGDPCSGTAKRLYVEAGCGPIPTATTTATPPPPTMTATMSTSVPSPTPTAVILNFEGLTATSPQPGVVVAQSARLSTAYLATFGVVFGSGSPYVAVVNLGVGHATSGTNGIGGTTAAGVLTYDANSPVVATFFDPSNSSVSAVTDFVSVRGDRDGSAFNVALKGFDVNGTLIASTTVSDVGGETLSLSVPGIHSVQFVGTNDGAGVALDDFTFNPVHPQ